MSGRLVIIHVDATRVTNMKTVGLYVYVCVCVYVRERRDRRRGEDQMCGVEREAGSK